MIPSVIIFDLDGTLLHTLEDLTESVNYVLKKYSFPPKTIDDVKNSVGNGVDVLIERVIPNGLKNSKYKECLDLFKKNYSKNMYNNSKPYDGILDVLKNLKKKGYKIAVISNKFDDAVKSLCDKYFNGYIDIAFGQKEEINKKPAPDLVYKVIKNFNVSSDDCVFVGDSEVDIQTAQNSNIPCISVTWGYKDIDFLYKNGAETLIYTPDEINDLL